MSIQLNVTVPLKAVAELRRLLRDLTCSKAAAALLTDRHTDGVMPTEEASDLVIAVLEGIKALPFDITPADDDASTVSFTGTETSSAMPSLDGSVESQSEWRPFTITVRDLHNKDEKFEVGAWDTMESLLFQYGRRRNVPASQYVLQFNGRIYSTGMNVNMEKIGIKDGSVTYVYPKYSHYATAPGFVGGTFLPDEALDHMPPKPKASTDFDYCDVRSEVTVTEDGKESKIEFTVRDLMNQLEKFNLSRYETLYELADRYADRTGLEARTLRFKFPSGSIHRVDVDDDSSLDDLGIEDGGVIVAMPDNINF